MPVKEDELSQDEPQVHDLLSSRLEVTRGSMPRGNDAQGRTAPATDIQLTRKPILAFTQYRRI